MIKKKTAVRLLLLIVLGWFGCAQNLYAQQVSGTVTDEQSGNTLPGVNILVKGTSTGTSTDTEGHYTLEPPSLQDTLVFSFIGYQTHQIPISGRTTIDVALKVQAISGEEMVVVGYGTQKKSDLTGSISSISSKDFNSGVNVSVDQLMQGRSAGVQISQTSGAPGGGTSVIIRGASSINGNNQPLYVIDGLPIDNSSLQSAGGAAGLGTNTNEQDPLSSINPDDISSIQILKDASATAIYGSRGANGVVLITTKEGQAGRVKVNYNSYLGVQSTARRMNILSTKQYIQVMNGISEDEGNGPIFSPSDVQRIGNGTNWQDQIYHTAPVTNQNLSVSGGNDNTTFRTTLNYFNQEGVVKNSGLERYAARINLKNHFSKNGLMSIHLSHSMVDNNNNPDGSSFEQQGGPISSALVYDPTVPVYNADGSYGKSGNMVVNSPVVTLNGISTTNKVTRTLGNVDFQYDFLKTLDAKISFGYDKQSSIRRIYNSSITYAGGPRSGIANISTLDQLDLNLKYTMHYNKQLNKNNSLKVLGGVTYQSSNNTLFEGNISGFPSDQLGTNNLGLGDTNNDNLNSNKATHKLFSFLGRVNYSLLNTYLFTASIRSDGSSRFGTSNRYSIFPSGAFAWKMAQEDFMPDFFNQFKLRASYGVTGSQDIGNYNYLTTYTPNSPAVLNNTTTAGISPSRIANPNLRWETTKQIDVGLDASIFGSRLSGSVDYFKKNTTNLLLRMPLPMSSGFDVKLTNTGQVQNKGIEIQINSTNIQTPNFEWNTTFNFSHTKNTVKSLGPLKRIITGNIKATGNTSIVTVGEPMFSYYGYKVTGIFQNGDNIAKSAQPDAQPGYPIFKDANGDGKITPDDRVILGNPHPSFTFGFSNTLSYSNFQLSFFITGKEGVDLANGNLATSIYPKSQRRNRLAEFALNRWTPANTHTKWPSGINTASWSGGMMNSLIIQDASYIQLRNIKLSYNIPQNFIRSAEVYITGQNLVTLTDYVGTNPDGNVFGRSNAQVDINSYPLARTLLLGVNLHF